MECQPEIEQTTLMQHSSLVKVIIVIIENS
jgi:hypothetical protein